MSVWTGWSGKLLLFLLYDTKCSPGEATKLIWKEEELEGERFRRWRNVAVNERLEYVIL